MRGDAYSRRQILLLHAGILGAQARTRRRDVPQPVDVYAWRNAILSEDGPASPVARVALMALSLHMKADGTGAWPSQALVAARAGISERSVRRHLERAERDGWLERSRVRRAKGRAWYRTEYAACVPDAVYATLPERPWEADPKWRRQGAPVAATRGNGRPKNAQEPANGAGQPVTQARVPANGGNDDRPSFGRLTLPLNSSKNFPKNTSSEGALARTSGLKRFGDKGKEEKTKDEERRKTAAITDLLRKGFRSAEIPRLVWGTTLEEVQRVEASLQRMAS